MKEKREITIYDIASSLGLSPSTVSRALNDHPNIAEGTKKIISARARKMGYRHNKFASSLRLRKTSTIGVVVPRLDSYFMATAIAGIESVTSRHGYGLIISQSAENGKKEAEGVMTLFNSRVDGFIVSLAYGSGTTEHFRMLKKHGIPLVFFDRVYEDDSCAKVIIDNCKAAYEVVTHLLSRNCKRIVYIGGNLSRNVYSGRLRGYRMALEDNNIRYKKSLVIINELTDRAGEESAKKILRMRKLPDAVFAANDTTAVSVIITLQKAGLSVPHDIAVAGFNNEPVSRVIQPNLTTVDYPAYEVGQTAALALIDRLNSAEKVYPPTLVLQHKLLIRESTLKENIKSENLKHE